MTTAGFLAGTVLLALLVLHQLWQQGLVPRLMTYEGGNVDIFVGLSAPFVAWFARRRIVGRRTAIAWNVLGPLTLANIIVRSALTAPGPLNAIRSGVPNLAVGTFPYTFIAGFLAPLAAVLHVLSLRHLRSQTAAGEPVLAGVGRFGRASPPASGEWSP